MDKMYKNRVETLEEFRKRTAWKDAPLGEIHVPEDQDKKVRPDGSFACMVGDTVIYELNGMERYQISRMRDALYKQFGDILCMPLPVESFHVTLHDLCALPPEARAEAVAAAAEHEQKIDRRMMQFRVLFPDVIRLRPTKLVSMVSRSIVLLLEPETDEDCKALTDMYRRLDEVVPLNYPLTPHVTLAYYKPQFSHDLADSEAAAKYERTLERLRYALDDAFRYHPVDTVELHMHRLKHRCFIDMANYVRPDAFADMLTCTDEELLAWQEFSKMYLIARQQLKSNRKYSVVLMDMAAHEMNLNPQEKTRKLHRCRSSMPNVDVGGYIDPCDYTRADEPDGMDGLAQHRLLSGVIILNLYDRGLLRMDAEKDKEKALITHCFCDLHWDC